MQELSNRSDEELFFEFLIIEGLKRIGRINDKRYVARAKFEFDRMIKKGYVKYFLASWEYVNFCRRNNIFVGAGRGSAAASLISHCLNLTEADPIKYGLLFERYLSEKRSDSPDFDSDFEDMEREKIFEHLINRYGKEHAVKIATYSRFHPKGILRDLGRIFNVPGWEINKVCSMVIERCISKDSKINLINGKSIEIEKLYKLYKKRRGLNKAATMKKEYGISYFLHKKKFHRQAIKNVKYAGKKQMFQIETESGKKIEASEDHKFFTQTGWKRLRDLKKDDQIMTLDEGEDYVKCKICGGIYREVGYHCLISHGINSKKYFKKFGTKDVCATLKKEKGWQLGKPYIGKKFFGKENVMSNKTIKRRWYEQTQGTKRRKIHSGWMKKNNPMFNKKTASKVMKSFSNLFKKGSKPQKKLYRIIRKNYIGKMRFDFYIRTKRSYRWLDVALINDKIDFEFDGSFWHETNKDRRDDRRRSREIQAVGWKVISIKDNDLNEENIKKILRKLKCLKK
jgi:intein/homing endonuclease